MEDQPNIFAINKPKGPTSHDVLYAFKRKHKGEKVGHAGTLDPLASGVLVVGVGRAATKLLHTDLLDEKEYLVTIRLGQNSTTDDEEGEKTQIDVQQFPDRQQIENALKAFIGLIKQVPPQYSAVKLAGVAAYKKARKGEAMTLEARDALVKKIEIIDFNWPLLKLKVVTGRGVYIRSLARDLGQQLGTGGYVSELIRTRVGQFTLEDAVNPAQL